MNCGWRPGRFGRQLSFAGRRDHRNDTV